MWNWLASGLASGATLILFDGNPFHPDPGVLWRMADAEGIRVFGNERQVLSSSRESRLRSTACRQLGKPAHPIVHRVTARPRELRLRISGHQTGPTVVIYRRRHGYHLLFRPRQSLLPVYRGEIQCRGLGMRTEIYDDDGHSVEGEKGELVCSAPFPSMPIGFFNDPTGAVIILPTSNGSTMFGVTATMPN